MDRGLCAAGGVGHHYVQLRGIIVRMLAADRLDVTVRWLRENRPSYVVELSPKMLKVSEKRLTQWLRRS